MKMVLTESAPTAAEIQKQIDALSKQKAEIERVEREEGRKRLAAFVRRWEWRTTVDPIHSDRIRVERRMTNHAKYAELAVFGFSGDAQSLGNWHGMSFWVLRSGHLASSGGGHVVISEPGEGWMMRDVLRLEDGELGVLLAGGVPERIRRE